jgi:hypothetical protein
MSQSSQPDPTGGLAKLPIDILLNVFYGCDLTNVLNLSLVSKRNRIQSQNLTLAHRTSDLQGASLSYTRTPRMAHAVQAALYGISTNSVPFSNEGVTPAFHRPAEIVGYRTGAHGCPLAAERDYKQIESSNHSYQRTRRRPVFERPPAPRRRVFGGAHHR